MDLFMQSVWGQSNTQQSDQPMAIPPAGPTSQGYTTAQDHSANQQESDLILVAGPSEFSFPNPPAGHPDGPPPGLPMCEYPIYQPAGHYLGSHALATTTEPPPSSVNWTPSTDVNLQIRAPNFHPWDAGATNTLGSSVQGDMRPTPLQLPPPALSDQVRFFPPSSSSYTTVNAMDPTYSINGFAAPNSMHEPSGSRPHIPHLDPEVHEDYQRLRLQAVLKDPRNQQPTVPVEIRREKRVVLGLVLYSDSHPLDKYGWKGVQLPQTRSVKSGQQTLSENLLKLSIQVFGGSTGAPNAEPCDRCWDREQQSINPNVYPANLQPYMIDFKSENLTTALSRPRDGNCLKVDVTFHFTCYSKHHEGTYKLIVKLRDESGHLVAHSLLPYEFVVKPNGNGTVSGRTRACRPARRRSLRSRSNTASAFALESRLPELLESSHPVPVPVNEFSQHNGTNPTQQIIYAGETNHSELGDLPLQNNIHTNIESISSAPSHFNTGTNPSSSTPNSHPMETRIGSASSPKGAERSQEVTGEPETEGASLSTVNTRLPTAVSRSQFPPEPQESLDQVSATPSNQFPGGATATTDSTSSRTSAAAETSLSSVSDYHGQQQAPSLHDGRRGPLENTPVEGEADPAVLSTEVEVVVPHKGPTAGGVPIVILGHNFPSVRLYVRFGDFITCTTRWNEGTLRCILPLATRPGIVKVTLSQAPSNNSPEFGRSFAHFKYEDSRIRGLSFLLKRVLEMLDGRSLESIFTSIQQRLEVAMGSSPDANAHTTQEHGGLTGHPDFQVEELEDISIRFLSAHSKATNWKQIVSLQNKSGQTMAHMAVMLGYHRLLRSLIEWGINLNLIDLKGSTALHYAFLCNESACAILLIRSGADELTLDELGRSPWDLNPTLADEFTSRLRGVPKVDGSFSVSCRPAEEGREMEHAEEAAALEANYLLVQRWLQWTEEERRNINDLNGEHMPQSGISPPCLPSNLGYGNDLPVEKTRSGATSPIQSRGMVPKVFPLSDDLHPDLQSINSSSPPCSEWDGIDYAESLGSTGATFPISTNPDRLATEDGLLPIPPIDMNDADPQMVNTDSQDQVRPIEVSSFVASQSLHASPDSLYAIELVLHQATQIVAQGIPFPLAPGAPSSSASTPPLPLPTQTPADDWFPGTRKGHDLVLLEREIMSSPWYASNALEPICGTPECPYLADYYGVRSMSCYTAFVVTNPDGTFGCWREDCSSYGTRRLDDALKHQRANHFNHKPFSCASMNITTCDKRFYSLNDLRSHQRRSH